MTTFAAPVPLSSRTRKGSLARLTLVELRKLADTRAGLWLLIVIALGAVATGVLQLVTGPAEDRTFSSFFLFGLLPSGLLLPVLGILSMTGEWTQRTALTTFTLVPVRGRVIAAKLAAGLLIAVAVTIVTAGLAAVANLVGGTGSWHLTAALLAKSVLLEAIFVLMGLGFGALLLNSPLAIVAYFAIPTLWTVLGSTIPSLHTAASWLDINETTGPLSEAATTGGEWARLAVSVAVWVLLPLTLGTARVLRREVS